MSELFARGYAVVVGVGADLPVTMRDAQAVADLLCDQAHCALRPEHVQLLIGEQARRVNILDALDSVAEQVAREPDASAIVYFSGHGLLASETYLLPFGYNLSDLNSTTITATLFTEKLRAIQSRKLLILLDCCHAGAQADVKAPPIASVSVPAAVLEELQRGSGRVLIASSRKDELSYTGYPYSAFTMALLEGLAGYGAFEQDGYARVLDIALYVARMVPNRTQDQQHPIVKVANLADNFALAYYAGGEATPKTLDWSQPVASRRLDSDVTQVAAWRRMLASRRAALLLMEERMSEYVEYQEAPLQLIKNQRRTETQIIELEQKLGII
jgi:hypothetical protein